MLIGDEWVQKSSWEKKKKEEEDEREGEKKLTSFSKLIA